MGMSEWALGDIVRELLGRGVNANAARSSDGMTSLMWACQNDQLEIARLLLAHHASKTAVSSSGHNAYSFSHGAQAELRELVKP